MCWTLHSELIMILKFLFTSTAWESNKLKSTFSSGSVASLNRKQNKENKTVNQAVNEHDTLTASHSCFSVLLELLWQICCRISFDCMVTRLPSVKSNSMKGERQPSIVEFGTFRNAFKIKQKTSKIRIGKQLNLLKI